MGRVEHYLSSEAKEYRPPLDATADFIERFKSPLGMELLGTVDWLIRREAISPNVEDVKAGLGKWRGGGGAGVRKLRLFDSRLIRLALDRLDVRRPDA